MHKDEYVKALEMCLRNRIQPHDTDLLTHAVTILATNGWERSESASFGHTALEAICQRFQIPLEAAPLDVSAVQEEWDDMESRIKTAADKIIFSNATEASHTVLNRMRIR